ncbi:MAG: glycosyltransferase, partial [Hyphomicrobiales bacterium]|nr:glycosyltransferase [Hyphomicrobiales bacterium]
YPFTTAFHTRFPEYVAARAPVPLAVTYALLRWFHGPSSAVMVATPTIEQALRERGFHNIRRWSRGVDTDLFKPREKTFLDLPRPISLYTGRIAVEKGIKDFLDLPLPGTKVLVGDGPLRPELARKYPAARFLGLKTGEDLARHYAAADVFVFPSRTDTFGLVLLEALACGVPVAAYPVAGPLDVIGDSPVGALDGDLGAAVRRALEIPAAACRHFAEGFSWPASVDQFLDNIHVFR